MGVLVQPGNLELAHRSAHWRGGNPPSASAQEASSALLNLLEQLAPRAEAETLHQQILAEFGSVAPLLCGQLEARLEGICSKPIAALLNAIGQLHRSALAERVALGPVLSTGAELHEYLWASYAHQSSECVRALYLNAKQELLTDEIVSFGSLDSAPVSVREVILRGLHLAAAGFILVHNHPSGDPHPSKSDVEITAQLIRATSLFRLKCYDHIIVARDGITSFVALGIM